MHSTKWLNKSAPHEWRDVVRTFKLQRLEIATFFSFNLLYNRFIPAALSFELMRDADYIHYVSKNIPNVLGITRERIVGFS